MKDEQGNDVYYVEGSFFKIPKTFSVMNVNHDEIALIKKKTFSFLPTFFVEVDGQVVMTIKKEFTFFKARYSIDMAGVEVHGNWWDMEFEVLKDGEMVGKVNKEWFTWGDSYKVQILKEEMEPVIVTLVIAIDYQAASASVSP